MAEENISSKEGQSKTSTPKEKNIGMAIVAYLIFFVPLLTDAKNDPFVKYHVKQGLIIFIGWIAVGIISSILPWQLRIISQLLDIFLFVLMIIGILNVAKGEKKPLPLVGKFGEQFKI